MATILRPNLHQTKVKTASNAGNYLVVALAILALVSLLAGSASPASAADTSTTPPTPTRTGPHYPPNPVLTPPTPLRKGVKTPRVTPGQPGSVDPSFKSGSGPNGDVTAIAVQSDSKIVIGGLFSVIKDTAIGHIARLNPDGSLDTTFNPNGTGLNPEAQVKVVALQSDGKIVVGGSFTSYNGTPANNIVRLNPDGSLDASFNPGGAGTNDIVNTLAVQSDGKIVLAGPFTSYNNITTAKFVIRLNPDGSLDATFNYSGGSADGNYYTEAQKLILQTDGKILISSRYYLSRVNPNGTADSSFQIGIPYANYSINSFVLLSTGKIVVSIKAVSQFGQSYCFWDRLNSDGSNDFSPNGFTYCYDTLTVQTNDKIIGTAAGNVLRYSSDGSKDPTFKVGDSTLSTINAVALQSDGKVLFGGSFTYYIYNDGTHTNYNGFGLDRIGRLGADGTVDTSFNTGGSGADFIVTATALQSNGKILIAGDFDNYNGTQLGSIARLNPDGTLDTTFNHGNSGLYPLNSYNPAVILLAVQGDDKILVAGQFDAYNGVGFGNIVRLNPDGSIDSSFNPSGAGSNGPIKTLVIQPDGKILIGGSFRTFDGKQANSIARLNPDGTLDTTFNQGGAGANVSSNNGLLPFVNSIAVQSDGKILIGGFFSSYNGVAARNIVRLNSDGSLDPTFIFTLYSGSSYIRVTTLALQSDGKILLGNEDLSSNPYHYYFNRLNPDGSADSSFNATINGPVKAVLVQRDGKILIGGDFAYYNSGFASLNPDGSYDSSFNIVCAGVYAFAVQNDGNLIIAGSFTSVNTYTRDFVARLIGKTASTVTVTSSLNPSTAVDSVTFTATLQPITATGTVRFTFNSAGKSQSVTTTVVNGAASYLTSTLPVGVTTVTAFYSGDGAVYGATSPTYTQTVTVGPPAQVLVVSGNNQQAAINTIFPQPLVARVTDALNNPVSGAVVTYTISNSGPSATFAGGATTYTATTSADGLVTSTLLTANGTIGVYTVTATVTGVANSATFQLFNVATCTSQEVTSNLDDGSCGTLRAALAAASTNQVSKTVTITLAAGSTISLTNGVALPSSVAITTTASCGSAANGTLVPPITLKGIGSASGDGLTLAGNNRLYGLWVKGFSGVQIKAPAGSHTVMQCVKASKN